MGAVAAGFKSAVGAQQRRLVGEGLQQQVVAGDRYELAVGEVLAFPGNLPHSHQIPDPAESARGVSLVVLAKAGV